MKELDQRPKMGGVRNYERTSHGFRIQAESPGTQLMVQKDELRNVMVNVGR
jgi:hypothetical protein